MRIILNTDNIFNKWKSVCNYADGEGDVVGECSVGRIAEWGAHYIAIIHDDVPEDERCEIAEFIADAPQTIKDQQATIDKLETAIRFAVKVKDHKDTHGKDDWYQEYQPKVWSQFRDLINSVTEKRL